MLGRSPLLGNDLGDLLAIPFRLSPRGKEKVMLSVIFVVGTSLVVAERRRYSLEGAWQLG
jgi:hypothetical protein